MSGPKDPHKRKGRWTGSVADATYVNAFTASGSREEIVLSFGTEPVANRSGQEEPIQLTDRIIVSPFTAKQLLMLLSGTLRNYESTYGLLETESPQDRAPPFGPKTHTSDKAAFLLQAIRDLGVAYGYERSFKMSENRFLANRFLLGVNKHDVAKKALFDLCGRMGMPRPCAAALQEGLVEANIVLFGFEENEEGCVYKVYLEYWDKIKEEVRKNPRKRDPMLMYLGFKWDALDNVKSAVARYTCHPLLSPDEILQRLSEIYRGGEDTTALDTTAAIVRLASSRAPDELFIYLEVSEEGNPRRSFDVNLYKAGLRMREIYPLISEMRRHYAASREAFDRLYEEIGDKVFGHLSGGMDRTGRDFLTTYYEIQPL